MPGRRGTDGMIRMAAADNEETERHVDEEHDAPAEPGEVERHQYAAERKAGRAGEAQHDAVDAEGAATLVVGEQQMQCGEHLRHHQRRGRALREPRRDQFRAGLRQSAP